LLAEIQRVQFIAPSRWCVLAILNLDDGGEECTAVGYIGDPDSLIGAHVELDGFWTTHPQYGKQFKFEAARLRVPDTLVGMRRYLESPHFKEIGPVRAGLIIEKYGDKAFDVIKDQPHLLTLIKGITPARADLIHKDYMARERQQDTFNWLAAHGVPFKTSVRIEAELRGETVKELTENPYRLMELDGFGFLRSDDIARRVGLNPNSPYRARAGVLHVLHEQRQCGHSILSVKQIIHQAAKLNITAKAVRAALDDLVTTHSIELQEPLVGLKILWDQESNIAEWIAQRTECNLQPIQ